MTYAIRPSEKRDIRAIDALLARTYPVLLKPDYAPSVMVTALPIISRARPELMTCGTYYVAETQDGQIVGAGGWTPSLTQRGWGDIRHVVTDLDHLRQGIARALMQRSCKDSAAAGVSHLECWSTRTAERFYKSVGFKTIGPMDVTLMGGVIFPAIRMQRLSAADPTPLRI